MVVVGNHIRFYSSFDGLHGSGTIAKIEPFPSEYLLLELDPNSVPDGFGWTFDSVCDEEIRPYLKKGHKYWWITLGDITETFSCKTMETE